MAIEITGKLIQVLQPIQGDGKNGTWKKQEFIIETFGQYPKKVMLQLWGEKTSLLNNVKEGNEIKVSFEPESREYNGRWYTDLRAWRIENVSSGSANGSSNQSATKEFEPMTSAPPPPEFKDDLPF
jgi:hypothetical protein